MIEAKIVLWNDPLTDNQSITLLRRFMKSEQQEGRNEIFYLTTHSTHFIYGYMASDIW